MDINFNELLIGLDMGDLESKFTDSTVVCPIAKDSGIRVYTCADGKSLLNVIAGVDALGYVVVGCIFVSNGEINRQDGIIDPNVLKTVTQEAIGEMLNGRVRTLVSKLLKV